MIAMKKMNIKDVRRSRFNEPGELPVWHEIFNASGQQPYSMTREILNFNVRSGFSTRGRFHLFDPQQSVLVGGWTYRSNHDIPQEQPPVRARISPPLQAHKCEHAFEILPGRKNKTGISDIETQLGSRQVFYHGDVKKATGHK
jgi:hypothetical protein